MTTTLLPVIIALAVLWALLAVAWLIDATMPPEDGMYFVSNGRESMRIDSQGVTITGDSITLRDGVWQGTYAQWPVGNGHDDFLKGVYEGGEP